MSATPTSFDANRPGPQAAGGDAPTLLQRLYRRDLAAYPATGPRMAYLAIVVVTTVVLYYMLYIQYAVATSIITHFDMTYRYFVWVSVIGNAVGAFASLVAGLADRWGRANMVVYGLLIASLLVYFGLPNAGSKAVYLVLFALVSIVEGIVLVATPALIRDFSPQLGRATAMGAWTMGPVVGSLVVTTVTSQTLDTSSWQDELRYSALSGLVVFVVAIVALRELSPRLRDQIMVTLRDRALVEARAKGIDPQAGRRAEWRQMLRLDIAGSGLAIALFLLLYFAAVGNFVVYFATTYGYSEQRANAVANWYWAANAIALVVVGLLSDRLKVRKPFMVVGAVGSIVMTAVFATRATHPTTDYYTFAWLFVGIGVFSGVAYGPWMAGFTETVEKHNPAATATGLAVWGWTIRIVVAVSAAFIPVLVTSVTPLVDHGPQVTAAQAQAGPALAIVGAHQDIFAELGKYPAGKAPADVTARAVQEVGPADLATVQKAGPQLAVLQKYGTKVQKAAHDGPSQWRTWWWICVGGQVLFLPFVFLMAGRWSPRKAREDAALHQAAVDRELASLT
ncbi:MFS transporter [Actinacidiphila bryophytorum]|uniref:Nitrate/nitrite transporter NarK n=1 Tax=Actinacidiphila bryophytorum TaxID=1436133 RepID=A0A9W4H7P5_9ACTN|nr:MFS transporter [Actinacidiphila bryophytorum]MBM9437733.1 MFS transporter [Actinacidiphila bryophytorum]MBN6547162.1 MFS transporter [Actinacidiphila bryophytorum]CAG7656769.1 Nitrate/nitrite transporter NarK [Actinacidiphila bryophytorum]